jgi:hypothetical protein
MILRRAESWRGMEVPAAWAFRRSRRPGWRWVAGIARKEAGRANIPRAADLPRGTAGSLLHGARSADAVDLIPDRCGREQGEWT